MEDMLAKYLLMQGDAAALPLADKSVDLVFGSPPYCDARTYGIDAQRGCIEWVEWMILCTLEAQRVCKGPVIWVAAGVTRKRNYWPACEGLMWEWWKRGGDCQLYRPCFWNRVGIPGSGGDDWFRADVEYVMCFKRPGALAWADNTAMGHPPKWGPGGEMSHRLGSGARVNQWGKNGSRKGMGARKADGSFADCNRPPHIDYIGGERVDLLETKAEAAIVKGLSCTPFGNRPSRAGKRADGSPNGNYFNGNGFKKRHTKSRPDGSGEIQEYEPPVKANPGNLVKIIVGGGVMGHALSHENEAPFPEDLARHFIKSLCPPSGVVLDPFSGSGTTVAVALQEGRRGIGIDIRANQIELARRRIQQPYAKRPKKTKAGEKTLFDNGPSLGTK